MAILGLKEAVEKAMAAAARGDAESALTLARTVLARAPGEPNSLQIIGLVLARQGRTDEAIDAFRAAESAAPDHPPILNSLGALLNEKGEIEAAKSYLARATRLAPGFAQAHRNLAELLGKTGEFEKAHESFSHALKADPENAESWGAYALFQEERHDTEGARNSALRALEIDPQLASAHIALAEIDARAGAFEHAAERMSRILSASGLSPINAAKMNGILARSLEKLGRHGESFKASKAANDIFLARYRAEMEKRLSPRSPESVDRMIAFFQQTDASRWTSFERLEGPAPVFFMGFPRSGTTLLDQILSSCDGVFVLEEKVALAEAGTEFILTPGGLERLPSLETSEINRCRAMYWKRVEAETGRTHRTGTFIDKLPMHTPMLGLIWRLFPEAKIIFSIRDPRDVVLSCFQQTFDMNVAMYQLLEIRAAGAYYDKVMRLADICRAKFPLRLHEVRYENIISNFRGEIEPVLNFLGIAWTENTQRFAETARKRKISTPSANQVIQGLYASSIGKWRNYTDELAPVLPVLEPWARRFGYDA